MESSDECMINDHALIHGGGSLASGVTLGLYQVRESMS